jgi:hypothetical protein
MDGHCISGASRTGGAGGLGGAGAVLPDVVRLAGFFVVREVCASADAAVASPSRMMTNARRTRIRGTEQAYRLTGRERRAPLALTHR